MNKLYVMAALISGTILVSFSTNPPDGNTGAPGDMLCVQCHVQPDPDIGGTLTLEGFPESITPNETYLLKIINRDTSGMAVRGGFQMTILSPINTRAGNLTNPSQSSAVSITNGRQYWDHNPAKEYPDSNVVSWTVQWTAPDLPAGSKITWYAAGNIADGNFQNVGDRIVAENGSGTVLLSANEEIATTAPLVFPNPGNNFLDIVFENAERRNGKVVFYSVSGHHVGTSEMKDGRVEIPSFLPGVYLINVLDGEQSTMLRWTRL